jgi:hypothetical protein
MLRRIIVALVASLAMTSRAPAQDKPAPAAPAAPKPEAKPDTQKPDAKPDPAKAPTSEEAALRAALKTLAKALQDGDREQIGHVIYASNPTERRMVDAMAGMAGQIAQLHKASAKAFGDEQARALTGDVAAEMGRIDEAQVSIEGDTAKVTYKAEPATPAASKDSEPAPAGEASSPPPLVLKKVDGRWQVPVAELSKDTTPEEIEQRLADLDVQTKVIAELSAEIAAGKYKSADKAAEAWQAKTMQALTPPRKPADGKGAGEKASKKPDEAGPKNAK